MRTPLVVDASVALKWIVYEPGGDAAASLLDAMEAGTLALVAPDHLVGELANGLRKRVGQGHLGEADALAGIDMVAELGVEFVGGTDLWFRSLGASLGWQLTTYDALYVLLAIELEAELVTADRRLLAAADRHSLPVRELAPLP